MILSEMFPMLNTYVDDVVDTVTATSLFNAGQDKMAVEAKASFPKLSNTVPTGTFAFPDKYHEIPVLYAAAMIKSQDSSIREKGSYMEQFMDGVRNFVENYDVPAQYRDEPIVQQFTTVATQTTFVITKEGYTLEYGNLKVYVNGTLTKNFTKPTNSSTPYTITLTYSNDPRSFTVLDTLAEGDAVTAVWEIHHEYEQPPFPWWGNF